MRILAVKRISDKFGEYYVHFGVDPDHRLYYGVKKDEPLYWVTLEPHEDQELINKNAIDYFGVETEPDKYTLIQPNWISFTVQFPYDPLKTTHGKVMRLKITKVEECKN